MEQLISFMKYYKVYIAISVVILLVLYFGYNLLYKVRRRNSIKQFENKFSSFNDKIKRDFCKSSKFQNYSLADFYISSSYNPFLTGFLKYDYISINMIKKVITYGARYIELEFFNKKIKNDTVPVIGSGDEHSQIINTQNTLDCKEVFTAIRERIFSEKYIDNYTDPFFIFLNLKTKNNITTLNKIYDLLIEVFNDTLLDSKFSYQKINIANTPICELMNKVIILSSDGYKYSKLEELINLSTTNPNLNRIQYEDLPTDKDMLFDKDKPLINLESKQIKLANNILYILDDTDFTTLNVTNDLVVVINNATNEFNDTPNNTFLTIDKVTSKSIIFNDTLKFIPEEPSNNVINIKFFVKEFALSNLNELNKSALTIVYTDNKFQSFNNDFMGSFMLGCQFVCMNFQNQDTHMEKYMKKFNKNSIIPKPSNLRNDKDWNVKNINSITQENLGAANLTQKTIKHSISIIKDFASNFTTVNILPFNTTFNTNCCVNKNPSNLETNCSKHKTKLNCLSGTGGKCVFIEDVNKCNKNLIKVIVKKNSSQYYIALSPNFNNSNSYFDIEPGLSKNDGSISIKFNNKYLVTDSKKEKCYLLLKEKPSDENIINDFNIQASFFPVTPKCNQKDFVSFMQFIKGEEYYIKYRSQYDYKFKLYKKEINISTLEFIGELKDKDNNILGIYNPKSEKGFKSIGSILINDKNHLNKIYKLNNTFFLYKGATSPPLSFTIVKTFDTYTIWKPVPSSGFVSLGIIITKTGDKPNVNNYCCIALDFLQKQPISSDSNIWKNNYNDNFISFWSNTKYFKVTFNKDNIPPNEFNDPAYDIQDSGTQPKNVLDRIFIEKISNTASKNQENTCFRVVPEKISQKKVEINEDVKSKLSNYNQKIKLSTSNPLLKNKCVGVDNIYWTKYYNNTNLKDEENKLLNLVNCKTNAYIGTNFSINKDKSIRLTSNSGFCLTKNENNYLELNSCLETLENQKFDYNKNGSLCLDGSQSLCLNYMMNKDDFNSDHLTLSNSNENNKWIISSSIENVDILQPLTKVIYKQLIPRGEKYLHLKKERSNNNGSYNFLNENIDYMNFHVFSLGIIEEIVDDTLKIKLFTDVIENDSSSTITSQNKNYISLSKNTNKLIVFNTNQESDFSPGTKVLCKNKGINYPGFNDENVIYWEATIINNDKLEDGYVTILFSINSIEADLNRNSLGRPRTNNPVFVSIKDLVLM